MSHIESDINMKDISTKQILKIGISIFTLYLSIYYWEVVSRFIGVIFSAVSPLLIGCMIAYIINILANFYEKHYFPKSKNKILIKSRSIASLVLALLSLTAIVVLIVWLAVPQLISAVKVLADKIPDALHELLLYLQDLGILTTDLYTTVNSLLLKINWEELIKQSLEILKSGVGNVMGTVINAVSNVISSVVTSVLAVIFAVYIVASKDKLKIQLNRIINKYINLGIRNKALYFIKTFDNCFHNFIVGQCTEALILGVLCIAGMLVLKLPYASMISVIVAFTSLVPVAGPYIGGGIGAFLIFTYSPMKAVIFIIFLIILQQIEGNVIYPKVVGQQVGLPGLWVLAAVVIGGGVLGVMGMIVGVPLTATIYTIIKDDLDKYDIDKSQSKLNENLETKE